MTKERCEEIVTGVVQHRAQESRANVADEESRSEREYEHYVVGGNRHHTMSSPIHIHAPGGAGHVMIVASTRLSRSFLDVGSINLLRNRRGRVHSILGDFVTLKLSPTFTLPQRSY